MKEYQYTPLQRDHSEIRLVRLQPGRSDDDITIEIIHAKVVDKPVYEALSYVWGSPERTDKALVLPQVEASSTSILSVELQKLHISQELVLGLVITKNLAEALRHLRLRDRSRIIWIDAICINQDDLPERSSEVSDMGSIYKSARQVLVWLGRETDTSDLALKTLKKIGKSVEFDSKTHMVTAEAESWISLCFEDQEALRSKEDCWVAIQKLLSRDWFSRLWVFQEIVLAKRATVVVGHRRLAWKIFVLGIDGVAALGLELDRLFPSLRIRQLIQYDIRMFTIVGCTSTVHLDRALECSQELHCTDPRDRLYGIRSILRPSAARLIIPDYFQSLEQVFISFAKEWLTLRREVQFFRFCNVPLEIRTRNLPSWVPDLSRCPSTTRFYTASSSGVSESMSSINDENHLSLQGVLVGSITSVVPLGEHVHQALPALCRSWLEMLKKDVPAERLSFLDTAFSETITGGGLYEKHPSLPHLPTAEQVSDFVAGLSHGNVPVEVFIDRALRGRSLFKASEGIFGLCPSETLAGDRVVVVLGCDFPLVIRPVTKSGNQRFQLLGVCYCPQYMFGEAFLGPLPPGWSTRMEIIEANEGAQVFTHGNAITQQDPRLTLPPDWRYMYGSFNSPESGEAEAPGDMTLQWFKNEKTGEQTYYDPRLTIENLKEKGVAIQEIILV